jgi:serine/arginine repetitive matrix protein 2
VPKKSKLGLLAGKDRDKDRDRDKRADFSDVVRRVGADKGKGQGGLGSLGKGGFDLYVDQTDDPELGDILVVKRKKSKVRGGLDGMVWSPDGEGEGALGEVTNVPSSSKKEGASAERGKGDEKDKEKEKWWTIGRGRKDSKEKEKTKQENKENARPKCEHPQSSSQFP